LIALAPALLAALLVHGRALGGEFVYDDNEQILRNPWVTELRYLPQTLTRPVWAYLAPQATSYYRPIQMGLYNLLWAIFGANPVPFHALSLLFHLLCVTLLFLLVREVGRDDRVAAGAALLFAVHPLNSEAVDWIACLPDLTYSCFLLLVLWLHLISRGGSGARVPIRVLAAVSSFLAILSKETAVVLLPLLFLAEIWLPPPEDESAAPAEARGRTERSRPRLKAMLRGALALIPYILATLLYLVLRWWVGGGIAPGNRDGLTFYDALLQAPVLVAGYLRSMLIPWRLVAIHVLPATPEPASLLFIVSLLGVAALVALILFLARRRPDLAIAGSLALLPLLPVLYIPALGKNAVAERYAYLPTAGVCWLLSAGASALAGRLREPRRRAVYCALLALPAIPFAARSFIRSGDWHDDKSLAIATLESEPRAWQMHVFLSDWYLRHGQFEAALQAMEEGALAFPDQPQIKIGLISRRLQFHRITPEEAIRQLQEMAQGYPTYYDVQYGLGEAYLKLDRPAEAEGAFQRAIAINPLRVAAHEGLFMAQVAQGRAVDWSRSREQIANMPALRGMDKLLEGVAEEKAGRLEEAEASLQEALKLDPKSARALLTLGVVEYKLEHFPMSADLCRQAILLDPDLTEAYQQLGMSAMRQGRTDEAIAALAKAVVLDPADKETLNRLGVAYAKAGRAQEARAAFRKALDLDPGFAGARANLNRLEQGGVQEEAK
jgi:tetratricopeptide (TPR) repeat protein